MAIPLAKFFDKIDYQKQVPVMILAILLSNCLVIIVTKNKSPNDLMIDYNNEPLQIINS